MSRNEHALCRIIIVHHNIYPIFQKGPNQFVSSISKHDEMNTINIVINSCDIKFSRDSFRISSIFFQWNQLFYTTIVTIRSLRRSELTYWTLANRL